MLPDWTDGAEGAAAVTDRGAEFHHGLVMIAGIFLIEHVLGEIGEGLRSAGTVTEWGSVGG